jgi:hypothetical protein
MRAASLVLILTFAGATLMAGEPKTQPKLPNSQKVAKLVARLGSRRFQERQAAAVALARMGSAALVHLQHATHGSDAEVRWRAGELIHRIERRIESAKLLAPKYVHIVYKNKAIPDAVAEFAKSTGFNVQLAAAAKTRLMNRHITLDTGHTTFWSAYAQLCAKAGLVEMPPAAPSQPVNPYGNGIMYYSPYQQRPVSPIILTDGKPQDTPVCYVGAMRVRMLPPGTPLLGHGGDEGETLFGLDIVPQPGIQWQGIVSMRVTKAVDNNDLSLPQTEVYVGEAAEQYGMNNWAVFSPYGMQGQQATDPTQIPVHLRLRNQPSKMLKELTGEISVQIQTPPMPLITVPDVLKAGGKEFTSSDRHKLKVLEIARQKSGQVRLRVQIEGPSQNGFGGMMVTTGFMGGSSVTGLTLQDAKGHNLRQLRMESMSTSSSPWAISQEMTIIFAPDKNKGAPARLVYTAPRNAVVDVPFKLHNLPLP